MLEAGGRMNVRRREGTRGAVSWLNVLFEVSD